MPENGRVFGQARVDSPLPAAGSSPATRGVGRRHQVASPGVRFGRACGVAARRGDEKAGGGFLVKVS